MQINTLDYALQFKNKQLLMKTIQRYERNNDIKISVSKNDSYGLIDHSTDWLQYRKRIM